MSIEAYADSVVARLLRWEQLDVPAFLLAWGAVINTEVAALAESRVRCVVLSSVHRMSQINDDMASPRITIAAFGIVQLFANLALKDEWGVVEQDHLLRSIAGENRTLSATIMRQLIGPLRFLVPVARPYLYCVCESDDTHSGSWSNDEMPHRGLAYLVCAAGGIETPTAPEARADCLKGLANWQSVGATGLEAFVKQIGDNR